MKVLHNTFVQKSWWWNDDEIDSCSFSSLWWISKEPALVHQTKIRCTKMHHNAVQCTFEKTGYGTLALNKPNLQWRCGCRLKLFFANDPLSHFNKGQKWLENNKLLYCFKPYISNELENMALPPMVRKIMRNEQFVPSDLKCSVKGPCTRNWACNEWIDKEKKVRRAR